MKILDVELTPNHIIILKTWKEEKRSCKRANIIIYI